MYMFTANRTAASWPWDSRVRLMPSARFFRRDDLQWQPPHAGAWSTVASGTQYFEDDFIHHGIRSREAIERSLRPEDGASKRREAVPSTVYKIGTLTGLLSSTPALHEACPKAEPSTGTAAGFDAERSCCRHARRRNQSSSSSCWQRASGSSWVREMASWTMCSSNT